MVNILMFIIYRLLSYQWIGTQCTIFWVALSWVHCVNKESVVFQPAQEHCHLFKGISMGCEPALGLADRTCWICEMCWKRWGFVGCAWSKCIFVGWTWIAIEITLEIFVWKFVWSGGFLELAKKVVHMHKFEF